MGELAVVWKYELTVGGEASIDMPAGAQIIGYAFQQPVAGAYPIPTVWALCDPHAEKERRRFYTVATGQIFSPSGKVLDRIGVATVQLPGGEFVLHAFELREPPPPLPSSIPLHDDPTLT